LPMRLRLRQFEPFGEKNLEDEEAASIEGYRPQGMSSRGRVLQTKRRKECYNL